MGLVPSTHSECWAAVAISLCLGGGDRILGLSWLATLNHQTFCFNMASGKVAKEETSIDLQPKQIGACARAHTHPYLPIHPCAYIHMSMHVNHTHATGKPQPRIQTQPNDWFCKYIFIGIQDIYASCLAV